MRNRKYFACGFLFYGTFLVFRYYEVFRALVMTNPLFKYETCKKVNWALGLIAIGALFSLITLRAGVNVTDEDTWFHLKAGKYIAQNGIPETEVFSFTMEGQPWVNHEWLWQTGLNALRDILGHRSVVLLQMILVVSIFAILLLLTYKRERIFLAVPFLFLILMGHSGKSMLRPDVVSLWFTVTFVGFLWFGLKKTWTVYTLFFLQVLWTNIHGFFILGPLLVLVLLISEAVKRRIPLPFEWNAAGRLSDKEYGRLKIALAVVFLACFVNPYFVQGFWYPFQVMLEANEKAKFFYSFVGELQPPITFRSLFFYLHPVYKLLIVVSFAGFLLNYRRIDLRILLLWSLFLAFSLKAARNILFFECAAYLSLMVNLSGVRLPPGIVSSRFWQRVQCVVPIFVHIGMVLIVIIAAGLKMKPEEYLDLHSLKIKRSYGYLSDQRFAHKGMDFLTDNRISGNFFNNLAAGHRLIAHNYPDIKVYIDGRTEVYGAEFFKAYLNILNTNDQENFRRQVNAYNITGVFLSIMDTPVPADFLRAVYANPEWKLVYLDYDAVIFLKDVPENKAVIESHELNLDQWVTKPVDPRLWNYSVVAKAYRGRAQTLKDLGFGEKAQNELNEALKIEAVARAAREG